MIKQFVTPQDVADSLNELLRLDPLLVRSMFSVRFDCNFGVEEHPTAQVAVSTAGPMIGFIGVLNSMFGVFDEGHREGSGCIAINYNLDGQIVRFSVLGA